MEPDSSPAIDIVPPHNTELHAPMNEEQEPQSPCIRNCCLNEQDVCLGCFRALHEITGWGEADAEERSRILQAAAHRKWQYARQGRGR